MPSYKNSWRSYFESNEKREVPKFSLTELAIGSLLGNGSFSNVNEIQNIQLKELPENEMVVLPSVEKTSNKAEANYKQCGSHGSSVTTEEEWSSDDDKDRNLQNSDRLKHGNNTVQREFMESNFIRVDASGNASTRYAIKRLRSDLSKRDCRTAISDLETELLFLTFVSHPNIIKMRGYNFDASKNAKAFLILDRLYDTLEQRIYEKDWFEQQFMINQLQKSESSGMLGYICKVLNGDSAALARRKKDFLSMRLLVAYDLASAMRYLHSHHLIYRDLKPENIGFDIREDVKLFDFGLAKELVPQDRNFDGTYNLTGVTGSRRYMAPEVLTGKSYNLSADVYSFGILLHEIISLQLPFENFDVETHYNAVVNLKHRPKLSSKWCNAIKYILLESWDQDPKKRPNFKSLAKRLKDVTSNVLNSNGVLDRTNAMMDKSNKSFHGKMRNYSKEQKSLTSSNHST